jgi:hypothetical protein
MEGKLFGEHERSHGSRFAFAVLHGHHHDSMPSALIGGPGQGFGEAFHEELCSLVYLGGTVLSLTLHTVAILLDMIAHQYIPGVLPYSRLVIAAHIQYVVHHPTTEPPLTIGASLRLASDLASC